MHDYVHVPAFQKLHGTFAYVLDIGRLCGDDVYHA